MNKKGQAAMDFLMTYGWAILVVLIVIGILAWFIKPSKLAPSKADFPGSSVLQIPKSGYVVKSSGTAQFVIENIGGVDFKDATLYLDGTACTPSGVTLAAGDKEIFNCTATPGKVGESFSGTLNLVYTADGIQHNTTGEVKTKYE